MQNVPLSIQYFIFYKLICLENNWRVSVTRVNNGLKCLTRAYKQINFKKYDAAYKLHFCVSY